MAASPPAFQAAQVLTHPEHFSDGRVTLRWHRLAYEQLHRPANGSRPPAALARPNGEYVVMKKSIVVFALASATAVGLGLGASAADAQPTGGAPVISEADTPGGITGIEQQALVQVGYPATEVAGDAPSPSADPAADPSATPSAETSAKGKGDKKRAHRPAMRRYLRRKTEHGSITVKRKNGKTATVEVQRGEVTSVDGSSATVKSADGTQLTWQLDQEDTRASREEKGRPERDHQRQEGWHRRRQGWR